MRTGLLVFLCLLVAAGASLAKYSDVELKTLYQSYKDGIQLTRAEFSALREAHMVGGSSNPVIDHLGGPDAFGYAFKDSDEPNGPIFNWIDITGTGTEVSESGQITDDDQIGPYPIGFSFPFYGIDRTQFYIHSNGVLSFSDWGWGAAYTNEALPGTFGALQDACLCPFWDDLDPYHDTFTGFDGGQLYYETMLLEGQNALIVTYQDVMAFPGAIDQDQIVTFQVIMFEDGVIRFQYNDISPTYEINVDAETTGLVNDDLTIYLESSLFDNPIDYPFNGLAIEYAMLPADASLSGVVRDSGTFAPIAGASVRMGYFQTMTDANGQYSFPDIYSGDLSYEVSAIGYVTISGTITLVPGENTQNFELDEFVAPAEILIVDVDLTPDSGPAIETILNDLGYSTYYTNDFFEMPFTGFDYVFLFVGVYPNDFVIDTSSPEEAACMELLNAGGNLYLEGADIFGYSVPVNLINMFNLTGIEDGNGDLASVAGDSSLAGLTLNYAGENEYIDHIEPANGAYRVLNNPADGGGCGVLDNSMDFNTALFTFELGMLTDTQDYTRAMIVEAIMENFGGGVPDWVTLDLIGQVVTVPPGGGTIVFDAIITSTLPQPMVLDAWTFVTIPNGSLLGPLNRLHLMVIPGTTSYIGLPQSVPGIAPGGDYTYSAYIGILPQFIGASDSFGFTKIGGAAAGGGSWQDKTWASVLTGEEVDELSTIPSEYALESVYPNPFNPTTTISVALPEASDLHVSIYNISGQLVATLADGLVESGTHNLTFDGSNLASGMYFVQATVPGELLAVEKIVLMK